MTDRQVFISRSRIRPRVVFAAGRAPKSRASCLDEQVVCGPLLQIGLAGSLSVRSRRN